MPGRMLAGWIVLWACLLVAAEAEQLAKLSVPSTIPLARLKTHVEVLASPEYEGRGTAAGRRKAINYLLKHFHDLRLEPAFGESFEQDVPGPKKENGELPLWGINVAGVLPGSDPQLRDEIIVLGVHFDHLGIRDKAIYPGADDNASSLAMMLEAARELSTQRERPKRTIAFVGFDLEEHLLWGSRWFAAHPPWPLKQVKLFITADLLGRSLGDLPLPVCFVMGSESGTHLRELLTRLQPPDAWELARLGADLVGTRSDYGPFRDAEVPFLFFSTGEHPDYHTPRDTPDRLDYGHLAANANTILELVKQVADQPQAPTWQKQSEGDLDEARTIQRITSLLLKFDAEGKRPLTSIQRLLVTQVDQKTRQILQRGVLSREDRPWLIRSTQALLFTVF